MHPPIDPRRRHRGLARQGLLGVMAFIATFALLVGATRLLGAAVTGGSEEQPTGPGTTTQPRSASAGGNPGGSPQGSPGGSPGAGPSSTSSLGGDGDPILIGAGDIASCDSDGDEATAALLDELPGTVFTAGDNVYPSGREQDFEACYLPSWGRHLERTRAVPGNHDWETGDLDAYFATFGATSTGPGGSSWYAFDLGTWHIVMLDSACGRVGGCDAASPQGQWLAADLAASDARCTMAIWHAPRFSSGEHGNDASMDPLWRAAYDAGVDVVVNGHDHDYERFAPQDADGNEDRVAGIRQFVAGTGGKELRDFEDPVANSELRAAVAHGLLEFTLRDGSYDWRFIPTEGDFSDRGTARCH